MKKRTISKLKSIFGSKKGKRQIQQESSKSSRSPSPEPARAASPVNGDSYRPIIWTPPPSRAGPPPSPPVPTHPVAPVAPEPAAPLPLMPCQVCGRTFVPQSLSKHVKICEKMTVKKRKTFDSSRQRREGLTAANGVDSGTDLEQYLPKNFGLPENSPFLEKSPPATAKPVSKPKTQSVRNAITKPMAALQRCPHCNRAFGLRAFERHVEWCADKAKILPAAPAQPPQQLADAKQRLNARTQYKAPPVRGRRSSETRDMMSNSRSASVESSRGVSPPPPRRECGDYRQGRTRASESGSSNDYHEETSPHVPVIRHKRNSQNSSGDANVKARQARLARDLSSTRKKQDPRPSSVQQSNTDPNIKKNMVQNKQKSKFNAKQQQLKKLEEIANKYSEKIQLADGPRSAVKTKTDKVQIPVPKVRQASKIPNSDIDTSKRDIKEKNLKMKSNSFKAPSEVSMNGKKRVSDKEKNVKSKVNKVKETVKVVKEITMSLDSLDDVSPNSAHDRNCQSVGINTELLCIPCVIHENLDQKKSARRDIEKRSAREIECNKSELEPRVELLYKNPTMDNAKDNYSKEDLSIAEFSNSLFTTSTSDNMIYDSIESLNNFHICEVIGNKTNLRFVENEANNNIVNDRVAKTKQLINEKNDEQSNNLSAEHFEINYEHDLSAELFNDLENKSDDDNINEENEIDRRHGSGDTYTKFTEDPADLEEFMNLTDKMISNIEDENKIVANAVNNLHTPATSSIEAINKSSLDDVVDTGLLKHKYSDTFEELKSNLKELLQGAKNNGTVVNKQPHDTCKDKIVPIADDNSDTTRNICDMEHITVYELKFYENQPKQQEPADDPAIELRLPAITETNKPVRNMECNKKKMSKLYKPNRKYKLLSEQTRTRKEYQTFIVKQNTEENSDSQSVSSDAPPLKLPRIELKRLDDNYDPFLSAARQMKELMSSDTNIPKKIQSSPKDIEKTRTLPALTPAKEKAPSSYLRSDNTKMMKDTLNKTYQKTPTLQRMKSFGSTNNENSPSTFSGRCSSFRLNRNDKKPNPKLNTTFTKSSKENISTVDKTHFNRNSNLNRSFSSYTASSYSTPKLKDKIPKIAASMYHSFQRTSIKQPVKLDKIMRNDEKKDFVNLDAIIVDDNSSMTDSNYIDPRLINENDNLPINVNTILNNPDIISSMESLLTTENLPAKFESFSCVTQNNNNKNCNSKNTDTVVRNDKFQSNYNINKTSVPTVEDLSMQYDKIMHSLEHSIASKTSVRDDDSLCEDFDLEEFMTSFDDEIHKHKSENKRTCSSTTRVVKQSELSDSNRTSELNSVSSSPKIRNGMIPVNKSMSLNFSSNNVVSENLFPSSVKRSTSLLDSIHKKNLQKSDSGKSRHKVDQLEQDIMLSLKDFDKFYESEKNENKFNKDTFSYNCTTKRDTRLKCERKTKKNEPVANGNYMPNGKTNNDSAYSRLVSMNRISPSKLSVCTPKENGLPSLDLTAAGSDSGGHKDDARSVSSDDFLALERCADLDEPPPPADAHAYREPDTHAHEKRASSRASSRRSGGYRAGGGGSLSSSGSEASLPRAAAARLSRFCHECGNKFPVDSAKFCIQCGVKRLVV